MNTLVEKAVMRSYRRVKAGYSQAGQKQFGNRCLTLARQLNEIARDNQGDFAGEKRRAYQVWKEIRSMMGEQEAQIGKLPGISATVMDSLQMASSRLARGANRNSTWAGQVVVAANILRNLGLALVRNPTSGR